MRSGCDQAFVRAEIRRERRTRLVEMEIAAAGRSRAQVNGQRVRSLRDLAEVVSAVVFCPADLSIAAGGPSVRRELLDNVLTSTDREYRAKRLDFERVLRQRNNLLKQTGHRADDEALATLDVWDAQLADVGEAIAQRRDVLCTALASPAQDAYCQLAGCDASLRLSYAAEWRDSGLATSLAQARPDDLRTRHHHRGPAPRRHDDLPGRPAGTHSRLARGTAQHCLGAAVGPAPVCSADQRDRAGCAAG